MTIRDDLAILIFGTAAAMNADLHRTIAFLDAQLRAVIEAIPKLPRLALAKRRHLAELAQRIDRARLEALARIVTGDTLRRWYRELIVQKWTHPHQSAGRPRIPAGTVARIVRLAEENPGMGSPGIAQRLRQVEIVVSPSTVRRVLREHGIDPAPVRDHASAWADFLAAHAHEIAAIDFTTVECFLDGRLVTQYCLFTIHHDSRRVHLVGITDHPNETWMMQQARNLTAEGGFLAGRRFVIMDRDGSFSKPFRHRLLLGGCHPIRTPPQSPNCNAYIERFFRSIKEECLRRVIPLSLDGLWYTIGEYLAHYHTGRPHQGLAGRIIDSIPSATTQGKIVCRSRLGGILRHYDREVA